ncbi:MAG: hypothetical protein K2X86_17450 [Cytophagaceae bacterium]|nr:hypothetical protein [Cytophagaceae bacterium]
MNYIKHLNKVMQKFYEDDRLLSSHISLYIALFQVWNQNRFINPVLIIRTEIMRAAKISSLSTYTKCLRQLHDWQYLEYKPSFNPSLGSRINMYNFCTCNCTGKCTGSCTETVRLTVQLPYINNINKYKESETGIPHTFDEVFIFFKKEKFPKMEAEKFYNHYQSNGWKVGGKTPMEDWQAAARKWMLNSSEFNGKNNIGQPKAGNLHTESDKNYSEPL